MEAQTEMEKGVRSHGRWAGQGQARLLRPISGSLERDLLGKGQEIALEAP